MGGTETIKWRFCSFEALSAREAHDLFRLRQNVFVIEQACLFPEIDGLDPSARHLLGAREGALAACARVLPAGLKMQARSIGRVATARHARGAGLGRAVMTEAIARLLAEDADAPIDLSAQAHLVAPLYAPLGFRPLGAPYEEDGIPHVDLRLDPRAGGAAS
jgi:ElaA protein